MRGMICYENSVCPTRPDIVSTGRPVVIVSADTRRSVAQVIPVTSNQTKTGDGDPMHIPITVKGNRSTALCEQLRTVRTAELRRTAIGYCTVEELSAIDRAIKVLLGLQ